MTYWALNAIFLSIAAAVAVLAIALRRPPRWRSLLLALAVVLVMTAVFDNVMIGVGLVGYNASLISGVFVGIAPLEDFAYALAAVVLLTSLWTLLPARKSGSTHA
jgi:lycopene cyclase domain-containing protein